MFKTQDTPPYTDIIDVLRNNHAQLKPWKVPESSISHHTQSGHNVVDVAESSRKAVGPSLQGFALISGFQQFERTEFEVGLALNDGEQSRIASSVGVVVGK